MKNLLVRTKFYWSWAGGLVLIVRTVSFVTNLQQIGYFLLELWFPPPLRWKTIKKIMEIIERVIKHVHYKLIC